MTITCPYCGFTSDECDFPDLFYDDYDMTYEMKKQLEILTALQELGYNVVTCGDCGQVFIQDI
jgi:hypothetical protein